MGPTWRETGGDILDHILLYGQDEMLRAPESPDSEIGKASGFHTADGLQVLPRMWRYAILICIDRTYLSFF